jgi:uncharacterized membrane protein
MSWLLIIVAALHALFSFCELYPWSFPILLRKLSEKHLKGHPWSAPQQTLVTTIVHNAGIYNAILAGGLLWAAFAGGSGLDVARILLIGAVVAGMFGTVTLRSWLTAFQAGLAIFALAVV